MSSEPFSKFQFTKSILLPAFLIFLVPSISLAFFLHAQSTYDARARESFIEGLNQDQNLTAEQRAEGTRFIEENPFSQLITQPEFANRVDSRVAFEYFAFRWLIRLSFICLVSGLAVLVFGGIAIAVSLLSPVIQYLTLLLGWQFLRIYVAFQVFAQGLMILSLSYWVTALWLNIFVVKLIAIAALAVLAGALALVGAIFRRDKSKFEIEGEVLQPTESPSLWQELRRICEKVGTAPPDQVILGIDDNFFVTEHPVTVGGKTYRGRSLFLSLALLHHLSREEADSVLAHEMAHFSGNDTLYSKKTSRLLMQYHGYLKALYAGTYTRPICYFMMAFLALYTWAQSKHSRDREFRADRIAADVTSPGAMTSALLRCVAYSHYRASIEKEIFDQEKVLESANLAERIDSGFPQFATSFLEDKTVGDLETSHPFDSHPSIAKRFEALGVELRSSRAQGLLTNPGDGRWLAFIDNADGLERQQWDAIEKQFRDAHESSLPYRFLPSNNEERAIVEKAFPEVQFEGTKGLLRMNYEKISFADWDAPLHFRDVTNMKLHDEGALEIFTAKDGEKSRWINLVAFSPKAQDVLEAVGGYYQRHATAVAYREHREREDNEASNSDSSTGTPLDS